MVHFSGFVLFYLMQNVGFGTGEEHCRWPDYFMRFYDSFYGDIWKRQWQTELRIRRFPQDFTRINGDLASRKVVSIADERNFNISSYKRNFKYQVYKYYEESYQCLHKYDNDKFMLKKTGMYKFSIGYEPEKLNFPTTYQCFQFIKRSEFVVQWKVGKENERFKDCHEEFGVLNNWPLVYIPVVQAAPFHILPHCPSLGGFQMKVYEDDGSPVINFPCKNDNPSPRLESGCIPGEGIFLYPSANQCDRYGLLEGTGAKLHCLGNWEDDKYSYTVVLPSELTGINSTHCLRINKSNPVSESAILFLDSVCDTGTVHPKQHAYFRLDLRKKVINSLCDNYSDQCSSGSCQSIYQATTCFRTCRNCPKTKAVETESMEQGLWYLQRNDVLDVIDIGRDYFNLPLFGNMKITGHHTSNRYTSVCQSSNSLLEGGRGYILTSLPGNGCLPRVVQVKLKRLNKLVSLIQISQSSALRNDKYALNVSTWCHNNKMEVDNFVQFKTKYSKYTSTYLRPNEYGWFTLIKAQNTTQLSPCGIAELRYAKIKVLIRFGSSLLGSGEAYTKGSNEWIMVYSLWTNPKDSTQISFYCLANYQVNDNYHGVILKVNKAEGPPNVSKLISETYYCLLLPRGFHQADIVLHTAGDCDVPLLHKIQQHITYPVASMKAFPQAMQDLVIQRNATEATKGGSVCLTGMHVLTLVFMLNAFKTLLFI